MANHPDYLGDKFRLAERAQEDIYFRKLDEELVAKMRQQAAQATKDVEASGDTTDAGSPFTPILVPVDFSPDSTEALLQAATIADRFGSSLVVVHVIPRELNLYALHKHDDPSHFPFMDPLASEMPEASTEELDAIIVDNRERGYTALQASLPSRLADVPVELRVLVGQPFERIIETAVQVEAGLIVMGTHGRTGLQHLMMGSVAERVVRLAPCPVMTVKRSTPETKSWLEAFYASFMGS